MADAYHAKYGWPATVAGDAFDAPYGAHRRVPPCRCEVRPTTVYGLGTDEDQAPRSTRWRF